MEREAFGGVHYEGVEDRLMARQWETAEDLANEDAVARVYAEFMRCEYEKVPKHYKFDVAFTREGQVVAIVEIRCRNNAHDAYPTIMLSLQKWSDIKNMAENMGVPAKFVVRFTDGIYTLTLTEMPDSIEMGGRALMRDSRDREPLVHFNVDRMKRIA